MELRRERCDGGHRSAGHRRRAAALGLGVLVALSSVACSGGGDDADQAQADGGATGEAGAAERLSTFTDAAGGIVSTEEDTAPAADPDELEALLITDVPDGYEVQPDDLADTGPADLATITENLGPDASEERAFFEENGFRRAYHRLWLDDSDQMVLVFLYEFEDRAGAVARFDRIEDTAKDVGALRSGGLDDVPASSVYASAVTGETMVSFVKGGFHAQVVVGTFEPARSELIARDLASDQFQRLP